MLFLSSFPLLLQTTIDPPEWQSGNKLTLLGLISAFGSAGTGVLFRLQLHQPAWVTRSYRRYGQGVRIAPVVDSAGLVGAGDGAARGALLGGAVLAPDILHRVLDRKSTRLG